MTNTCRAQLRPAKGQAWKRCGKPTSTYEYYCDACVARRNNKATVNMPRKIIDILLAKKEPTP